MTLLDCLWSKSGISEAPRQTGCVRQKKVVPNAAFDEEDGAGEFALVLNMTGAV